MRIVFLWLRAFANFCLAVFLFYCAWNYQTAIYLIYQASGQLRVLSNTLPLEDYAAHPTSAGEQENIRLVEQIKAYSVDSLGYKPTDNFRTVYDQGSSPTLWVITACAPYDMQPYEWHFPVVGKVSYKGFFRKELAIKEYNHLVVQGYDVDLRPVTAWSTLGWLKDPLLSSTLKRSKGGLCNLLFHELFHATYYAKGEVDLNENIASFVAHKATQRFLKNDTAELQRYTDTYQDNAVFDNYMLRGTEGLKKYYRVIENDPRRYVLKLRAISRIADSIGLLPLHNRERFIARREEILSCKNAYFVDFRQYDSMQDSLEKVFNKIYKGDIKKLVQDLRSD